MEKPTILLEDHDFSEIVNFKICTEEKSVSKNGNNMIKLGIRCTNSNGAEIDKWFNQFLTASDGASRYAFEFCDALSRAIILELGVDANSGHLPGETVKKDFVNYEDGMFKGAEGACQITKNGEFHNLTNFQKQQPKEEGKDETLQDLNDLEEIPF